LRTSDKSQAKRFQICPKVVEHVMRPSLQPIALVALLLRTAISVFAASPQNPATSGEPLRGSIAGSVTIAGKPASRCPVVFLLDNNDQPVAGRTVTDETGHFKFADMSSGRYLARVIAPTWAPAEATNPGSEGLPVSLRDGEELQGIDLSLVRGAVLTGRVTDHDGLPAEGEQITLCRIADDGSKLPCRKYSDTEFATDDRGIYRIYGIPPGRYTVSVGKDRSEMGGVEHSGGNFVRTFYPATTNENQAVAVDATSGGEATGIDIALGKPVATYRVAGRITNADTGQVYVPNGDRRGANVEAFAGPPFSSAYFKTLFGVSDDKGKFEIIGGVVPGKYAVAVRV